MEKIDLGLECLGDGDEAHALLVLAVLEMAGKMSSHFNSLCPDILAPTDWPPHNLNLCFLRCRFANGAV
jgi:hypothetical protein